MLASGQRQLPGASKHGGELPAVVGATLLLAWVCTTVQLLTCRGSAPQAPRWACGQPSPLGPAPLRQFALRELVRPHPASLQTHALLFEAYNPAVDAWGHVELPPNANPRRSFLTACALE